MVPSFPRPARASRPARRRPSRRPGRLAVEQFEGRLLMSGDVLTYHDDNGRTGQYLTETTLTPTNVNSGSFGKLFTDNLDGQVYAQPLFMANVAIAGQGTHNVVFVATEDDSLYALDADDNMAPLWQARFVDPSAGVTVPTNSDIAGSTIIPTIGITSTPVIDASTGTIYVVANVKVTSGGTSTIEQVLHAVDVTTGADRASTVILPTLPGTGAGNVNGQITYQAQYENQRSALLLDDGVIYVATASYGDNGPYQGWLVGYDATSLAQVNAFIVAPDYGQGGIWMSGSGPAADAQGNIYLTTGNGPFTAYQPGGIDYGQAYLKLSTAGGTLKVVDYFAPYDANALNNVDGDIGSSGVTLLPDIVDPATGLTHQEAVGGAKHGTLFLLDRNNLGGFNSAPGATSDPNILQEVPFTFIFSTPAYYNGQVYFDSPNDPITAFALNPDGTLNPVPASETANGFAIFGSSPSISADGASDGIVWANNGGILEAYDASNLANKLYSSDQAGSRDFLGNYVKFSVVTVADGKVYVGTSTGLVAFGLLSVPTTPPAGLSAVATSSTTATVSWSDTSPTASTDTVHVDASTDGGATFSPLGTSTPGARSFSATGLSPSTSYVFRATTFNGTGDSPPSNTATAATPSAAGEVNYLAGFAGEAGLVLVGNAQVSGTGLQLTDGGINEVAAAYTSTPVAVSSFLSQFHFQLTNPRGEGFTFIIQGNGPTSIGGGGGGLGSWIIPKSVAVKFDLANNSGEGSDTTGLFLNGVQPTIGSVVPTAGDLSLADGGINLFSGDVMNAFLTYDGATLQVTITDTVTGASATQSYAVNIPSVVGGPTAYVGFTAATDGSSATQTILDWSYSPGGLAPPAAPTALTAARPVPTEVDLSWVNNSPTAAAILVEESTDGVNFNQVASIPGSSTSYALTGLGASTPFTFRIRALSSGGDSPYSNSVTNPPIAPPLTPTNGAPSQLTATSVVLTWDDNATNETSYQILRKAGSGTYATIATLPANTTTYTDSGLSPNTTYSYHILAVNAAGNTDFTGVLITTPPPGIPQAPEGVRATAVIASEIDLSWIDTATAAYAVTGVVVEESTDGVNFTPIATLAPDANAYAVTGLAPSTTYTFGIAAENSIGDSDFSYTPSITTQGPTAPATLDYSGGFAGAAGLGLTNKAAVVGTRLRLTDGGLGEAASAFTTAPVGIASFSTRFTFQLTNAQADGFTFAIQGGAPNSIIWGGAGLGSWNMARSVAVKFDLYNNAGEGGDSTGLFLDGAYPNLGGVAPTSGDVDLTGTGIDLHAGDIMTAAITYDGATLTVTIADTKTGASASQSYAVDIPTIVGGPVGYVGFTAGTGGLGAVQDILGWTYTNALTPPPIPSAPTDLSAAVASAGEIDLSWIDTADDATAVLVEESTDGVNFNQVASLAPGATTYAVIGLAASTPYTFRVRAAGASGDSAYSNLATGTTAAPPIPSPPSGLSATVASTTEIDLSWSNTADDATAVLVEESTDGVNFNQVASLAPGATTYAVIGLAASTPYTFRVRAAGAAGDSDYSSTIAATTATPAPPSTLDYSGGFAGAAGLGLTNKAAVVGTRLRLTDGGLGEAASAFTTAPVGIASFSTRFTFQLTNAQADGFTFAIQGGAPNSIIWGGAGLGSWNMARSVAVKFDLYNNAGEGGDSTGLFLDGAYPNLGGVAPTSGDVDLTGTGIDLHAGDIMTAAITYDGATLTVTIADTKTGASASQSYAVDIPTIVGGPVGYVGFTAGTGGLGAVQDILGWTYTAQG